MVDYSRWDALDVSSDDEPVGLIIARQGGDVSSDDEPVGLLVPASA